MKQEAGKFSFAIPEGHPDAGKKIEKAFEFKQVENETEAAAVIAEKKWSIVDMVNDTLKSNARSNAYQNALLPYRPSEVTPDEIKERVIRDLIRLGMPEDAARAQADSIVAATAQATPAAQ